MQVCNSVRNGVEALISASTVQRPHKVSNPFSVDSSLYDDLERKEFERLKDVGVIILRVAFCDFLADKKVESSVSPNDIVAAICTEVSAENILGITFSPSARRGSSTRHRWAIHVLLALERLNESWIEKYLLWRLDGVEGLMQVDTSIDQPPTVPGIQPCASEFSRPQTPSKKEKRKRTMSDSPSSVPRPRLPLWDCQNHSTPIRTPEAPLSPIEMSLSAMYRQQTLLSLSDESSSFNDEWSSVELEELLDPEWQPKDAEGVETFGDDSRETSDMDISMADHCARWDSYLTSDTTKTADGENQVKAEAHKALGNDPTDGTLGNALSSTLDVYRSAEVITNMRDNTQTLHGPSYNSGSEEQGRKDILGDGKAASMMMQGFPEVIETESEQDLNENAHGTDASPPPSPPHSPLSGVRSPINDFVTLEWRFNTVGDGACTSLKACVPAARTPDLLPVLWRSVTDYCNS